MAGSIAAVDMNAGGVPPAEPGSKSEFGSAMDTARFGRNSMAADPVHPPPEPDPAIVASIQAKLAEQAGVRPGAAATTPVAEVAHTPHAEASAPQQIQAVQQGAQIRTDDTVLQLETKQLDQATEVRNET